MNVIKKNLFFANNVFSRLACQTKLRKCGGLERAKGIEPSYAAWEAAVLPLNYARNRMFSNFWLRFGSAIMIHAFADCNRAPKLDRSETV